MQHTLSDMWTRRGLIVVAILAGLAALSVSLIPSTQCAARLARDSALVLGTDAHTYAGDRVYALDQNGNRLASTAGEDHPVVDAQGGWAYVISTDEASRVTFRIETRDGTLETNPYTVVGNGEDTEISIRDFTREVSATLPVEIRARVYPSSQNPSIPFRSIEFNLRADGVTQALSNNPRERTIRPNHASGRWYRSNWFELGDGFRAAIIACKDQNGGVRFGSAWMGVMTSFLD